MWSLLHFKVGQERVLSIAGTLNLNLINILNTPLALRSKTRSDGVCAVCVAAVLSLVVGWLG